MKKKGKGKPRGMNYADVVNVTEQIIQLFGLETDFKVARHAGIQKTLKRIREEEQANETRDEPARRNFQ